MVRSRGGPPARPQRLGHQPSRRRGRGEGGRGRLIAPAAAPRTRGRADRGRGEQGGRHSRQRVEFAPLPVHDPPVAMASGDQGDHGTLAARLAAKIRVVPDFPSPGIAFQDVTPVLADAELFREAIDALTAPWRDARVTHVAGIESRGFIFAAPVALALGAGFIPIRKPGKLPFRTAGLEYALEYGAGRLEVHEDACPAGARVLVVDDVLATGGTARAACELIEGVGGRVVGCGCLLAIRALAGQQRLGGRVLKVTLEV